MSKTLTSETVMAMARLAGHDLNELEVQRIARAIGPALAGFSAIEGTLPFEAEPSRFVHLQTEGLERP